ERGQAAGENAEEHAAAIAARLQALSGHFDLTCRLPSRVFLSRGRLELKPGDRLVADNLRVVARLDHVDLAGVDHELGAVLMRDAHASRLQDADMPVH